MKRNIPAGIVTIMLLALMINFSATTTEVNSGEVKQKIQTLEEAGVSIWVDRGCGSSYQIGEDITFSIKAKRSGYLTVLDFSANGSVYLLYPNKFHQDNYIKANKEYTIPSPGDRFDVEIEGPEGEETLLAIVTEERHPIVEPISFTSIFPQLSDSPNSMIRSIQRKLERFPKHSWYAVDSCSVCIGGPCSGWAVFIGINDYLYNSTWQDLNKTINDAKAMYSVLKKRFAHVWLLTDVKSIKDQVETDDKPTKKGINKAFTWLRQASEADPVVIYFAGHGYHTPDQGDNPDDPDVEDGYDEFIAPQDSYVTDRRKRSFENIIVDDQVFQAMRAIPSFKKVLILDSCYSGTMERNIRTMTITTKDRGMGNLTDSIGSEFSRTGVRGAVTTNVLALEAAHPEGNASEACRDHGCFTKYLLEAFRATAADQNGDNSISAQEAFKYAKRRVQEVVSKQNPMISGDLKLDVELSTPK